MSVSLRVDTVHVVVGKDCILLVFIDFTFTFFVDVPYHRRPGQIWSG